VAWAPVSAKSVVSWSKSRTASQRSVVWQDSHVVRPSAGANCPPCGLSCALSWQVAQSVLSNSNVMWSSEDTWHEVHRVALWAPVSANDASLLWRSSPNVVGRHDVCVWQPAQLAPLEPVEIESRPPLGMSTNAPSCSSRWHDMHEPCWATTGDGYVLARGALHQCEAVILITARRGLMAALARGLGVRPHQLEAGRAVVEGRLVHPLHLRPSARGVAPRARRPECAFVDVLVAGGAGFERQSRVLHVGLPGRPLGFLVARLARHVHVHAGQGKLRVVVVEGRGLVPGLRRVARGAVLRLKLIAVRAVVLVARPAGGREAQVGSVNVPVPSLSQSLLREPEIPELLPASRSRSPSPSTSARARSCVCAVPRDWPLSENVPEPSLSHTVFGGIEDVSIGLGHDVQGWCRLVFVESVTDISPEALIEDFISRSLHFSTHGPVGMRIVLFTEKYTNSR